MTELIWIIGAIGICWLAFKKIKGWVTEPSKPVDLPQAEKKKEEDIDEDKFLDFKNRNWKFRVIRTDSDGCEHTTDDSVTPILLQDIRDQNESLLKATEANTKEVKALREYLMQVFGWKE